MIDSSENGDEVNAQAAAWVIKSSSPEFDAEDLDALNVWLEVSEQHLLAYERAEDIWMAAERPANALAVLPLTPPLRSGTAASRRAPSWRRGFVPTAAIAATLVAAVGTYTWFSKPSPVQVITYQTVKGQKKHIKLPDGSTIDLNSDTQLKVALDRSSRNFTLDRGEVLFSVVHDPAHPLTVHAGDARIDDIGTRFDVYRGPAAVTVAVLEGAVSASNMANAVEPRTILTANQSVVLANGTVQSIKTAAAQPQIAWLNSEVSYKDATLEAIADDLNRYFDKPIIVEASARRLKLTVAMNLDSEDLVVKRLEAFLPITAATTSDHIVLRLR